MTAVRLVKESSFEEYFDNNCCEFSDQQAVIADKLRHVIGGQETIDGLPSIDTRFLHSENFFIIDYFSAKTGKAASFKYELFTSRFCHQGSFTNLTYTYYFLSLQDKQLSIPGGGAESSKINRMHHFCFQANDGVIFIELFSIPSYRRSSDPEVVMSPDHSVPIAKLLTISLIEDDEVLKPRLLRHKIFVLDEIHGNILFEQNDPHLERRYDKSNEEVEVEIKSIILPFQVFGALRTYNQLTENKMTIPRFFKNPKWEKVPESIDELLCCDDWMAFYNSVSHIDWNDFLIDLVTKRFDAHCEIAKRFIPKELPTSIDLVERKKLQQLLREHKIEGKESVFDDLNQSNVQPKSIEAFLILQIGLERTLQDFVQFHAIMREILKKIIVPKKILTEYQDTLKTFEKLCYKLRYVTNKRENKNKLMLAGHEFSTTLENIKKNRKEEGIVFSKEELDDLIALLHLTKLLISHLAMDKPTEEEWDRETTLSYIEKYDSELKKFTGKYQASTTFSKVTTGLGGATTSAGAIAVGASYSPTFFAPLAFINPVIAVPAVFAGLGLTAMGYYGYRQSKKGELWNAGESVLNAAKDHVSKMQVRYM